MAEYKWRQQYRPLQAQLPVPAQQDDIIIVSLSSGGQIDYRLRTTLLTTEDYGKILAAIVGQIATMMAREGHLNETMVRSEIIFFLNTELYEPSSSVTLHQLQ